MPRYDRAPSASFLDLLRPGGPLSPLLRPAVVSGLPLDVHLREGDHLQLYCGLSSVLDASVRPGGLLRLRAHPTYAAQPCASGLLGDRPFHAPGRWEALAAYLNAVEVSPQHTRAEGAVQSAWATVSSPWIPFDREAVIGYPDGTARGSGRQFEAVKEARRAVAALAAEAGWAALPEGKVAAELDQLAVDPLGRLVLIELKDSAASAASVYYAPLQLLQYIHEWSSALSELREGLNRLLHARMDLRLTARAAPPLLSGLRPVIAFGADRRGAEVRRRFEAVRAVVNRHLPEQSSAIEVWAMEDGRPTRLG